MAEPILIALGGFICVFGLLWCLVQGDKPNGREKNEFYDGW